MDRRAYLLACGTALAGCLGDSTTGLSEGRRTGTHEGISDLAVHSAIATADGGNHVDVEASPDAQFLTFTLAHDGAFSPNDVKVVLDGEGYARTYVREGFGTESPVKLGIRVPVHGASEGALVRDDRRLPLSDEVLTAIANRPRFDLRRLEVPATVDNANRVPVTVEVANTGARDGVFLAELGTNLISDTPEFRLPVPKGETATHETTISVPITPSGDGEFQVVLDWGLDRRRKTTRVEN